MDSTDRTDKVEALQIFSFDFKGPSSQDQQKPLNAA
jgi:hypothetical protein